MEDRTQGTTQDSAGDTNRFAALTNEQINQAKNDPTTTPPTAPAGKTKASELIIWIVGLPLLIGSIPYCLSHGLVLLVPILAISIIFDIFVIVASLKK